MISQRKAANALSGKTARACHGCSRKRARWFCVADDAFLCQSCDESVHSANPLASLHERVRLETASFKPTDSSSSSIPTWHQGFTKKARTPRHNKSKDEEKKVAMNINNPLPLVPEIGNEESNGDENEDDLIYRVPVFDPFAAELCNSHILTPEIDGIRKEEGSAIVFNGEEKCDDLEDLHGFLPSDVELAEFAADVENLLGKGLDEDYMKDFKMVDCKEEDYDDEKFATNIDKNSKVKDEQEMEEIIDCHLHQVFGVGRESFDWNFDYESPVLTREGEDREAKRAVLEINDIDGAMVNNEEKKTPYLLRLNYEAIINAWASQGSPWTTGNCPQLNPDDCLPNSMDGWGKEASYGGGRNGAREARVLRYKEKRRTRLFSKKIRYEVRKLNAEKRPRMKGRFVKRTSSMSTVAAAAFPSYIKNQ